MVREIRDILKFVTCNMVSTFCVVPHILSIEMCYELLHNVMKRVDGSRSQRLNRSIDDIRTIYLYIDTHAMEGGENGG